jgi:hypothetical protein
MFCVGCSAKLAINYRFKKEICDRGHEYYSSVDLK